jgi:hypothetical protein
VQHPMGRVLRARAPPNAGWGGALASTAARDRPLALCRSEVKRNSATFTAGAVAQIGICGFDGTIELQALRLYGLPGEAPALPPGTREFQAEVSWDLPLLAPSITSLLDVTVANCRVGDLADAALASSTRFIELDATAWTTNTVRVMARNISSSATFDLVASTLPVTKRQFP